MVTCPSYKSGQFYLFYFFWLLEFVSCMKMFFTHTNAINCLYCTETLGGTRHISFRLLELFAVWFFALCVWLYSVTTSPMGKPQQAQLTPLVSWLGNSATLNIHPSLGFAVVMVLVLVVREEWMTVVPPETGILFLKVHVRRLCTCPAFIATLASRNQTTLPLSTWTPSLLLIVRYCWSISNNHCLAFDFHTCRH